MGKILPFKRVKQQAVKRIDTDVEAYEADDEICAIMNDHSLTPANRRWILENMLMNIDEQLEEYKHELEKAERKLDAMVHAAEADIAAAFAEFEAQVEGMTHAVNKLTKASRRRTAKESAGSDDADCQGTPQ